MELGTRYEIIETVVNILERHLNIDFHEWSRPELGRCYSWSSDFGSKNGIKYYGIDVIPAHYAVPTHEGFYLGKPEWESYSFIIDVADELTFEAQRLKDLIEAGILIAEEIGE